MMIVWGHNNFRLKAVQPVEIGLINQELAGFTFELRQKYGHLFWIPFIPLGKFWVVKKQDSKLYQCPPEIEVQLYKQYPIRTSLWAWTGPLLILAGIALFSINEKLERSKWEKRSRENYANAATVMTEKIKNARASDYLLMVVKRSGSMGYEYTKVPLKVLRVNNDTLTVARINPKYKTDNENRESVNNNDNQDDNYNSEENLAAMEFRNGIKDTFMISKTTLLAAICHDNKEESRFAGIALKEFTTAGNCMLKDVVHVEGPVLKQLDLTPDKRDGKYYEFRNMGFNVHADSIVTSKKDGAWLLSKERQFFHEDVIAIKCNTKDSAILYSSDWRKRVYKNKIDNTGYYLKVEAVAQ